MFVILNMHTSFYLLLDNYSLIEAGLVRGIVRYHSTLLNSSPYWLAKNEYSAAEDPTMILQI